MDPARQPRVTACATCRKLKMRFVRTRSDTSGPCDRCIDNDRSCFTPQVQKLGRKRGSVGRYQGVDKAMRNLQLALKKAEGQSTVGKSHITDTLSEILDNETSMVPQGYSKDAPLAQTSLVAASSHDIPDCNSYASVIALGGVRASYMSENDSIQNTQDVSSPRRFSDNQSSIKNNPLWLIADSSREALASTASHQQSPISESQDFPAEDIESSSSTCRVQSHQLLNASACVHLGLHLDSQVLEEGLDAALTASWKQSPTLEYFRHRDLNQFPDTGPDLDPIDQGLVTIQEAQRLFPIYFERVDPISCILDPKLHTVEFVRSRSALLFTWILAITAQFEPEYSNLAIRLRAHGERLCKHVYTQGLKSTEIVQGYYLYLHTATPAPTYGEERVWLYTAYALASASILYLDEPCRRMKRGIDLPKREYELLSRNRERTWLRMLAWERANSAIVNRVDVFPDNDLLRSIETWWRHPLATVTDIYTCAFITLRQRVATLRSDLRRKAEVRDPDPHWIANTIDNSLAFWHHCWIPSREPATKSELIANIYLRHVYMHARVWALSFGLSTAFGPNAMTKPIVEDCFRAAIECCERVVQDLQNIGESLYLMMNPVWAMVCYAAVLALKLFPLLYGEKPAADVQLIALLSQVAIQLERAGSTPPSRQGLAALLGQHLKMILHTRISPLRAVMKQPTPQTQAREQLLSGVTSGTEATFASHTEDHSIDLANFDPTFTTPIFPGEGLWEDDFGDFLHELFGQRFGQ